MVVEGTTLESIKLSDETSDATSVSRIMTSKNGDNSDEYDIYFEVSEAAKNGPVTCFHVYESLSISTR